MWFNLQIKGAVVAGSVQEVASNSDIIFAIVGFPSDVRSVFESAIGSMKAGGIFVDMTTSDPSLAKDMYETG